MKGTRHASLVRWLAGLIGVVLAVCCNGSDPVSEQGSETHFLTRCEQDCSEDFVCRCGICTRVCSETAACTTLASQAACVPLAPRVAEQRCESAPENAYCDVPCLTDGECSRFGEGGRCERGYCRTSAEPEPATPECEAADIDAAQLLILGDSLLELSGFGAELEQVVAADGALASAEHYRNHASSLTSFLAEGPFSVATQYSDSLAEGSARVVIMNGGATDMLQKPCPGSLTADCPEVQAAVRGAEALFARMAADGVEHLVYLSYPNPRNNPSLQEGLDVLRPLVYNACGKSPLACQWLELRPVFDGHDDYLGPDGIVFSTTGARATSEALWALMQARCVPR